MNNKIKNSLMGMFLAFTLWMVVAACYFLWCNPKLNNMQFYRNFGSAMAFEGELNE
jgi:hypothetical protein